MGDEGSGIGCDVGDKLREFGEEPESTVRPGIVFFLSLVMIKEADGGG